MNDLPDVFYILPAIVVISERRGVAIEFSWLCYTLAIIIENAG